MTSARPPDRLEVPVERLDRGRANARRAGAVAIALVTVVGGAFGLARLSERGAGVPSETPRASAFAARPTTPPASASPSAVRQRVETLPDVPALPLAGAPETTLVERSGEAGTDLRIFVWTPDDARTRTIRVIRGVLPTDAPGAPFPILAPDRRHLVLLQASTRSDPLDGTASLIDDEGSTLWTADGIPPGAGAVWSADSRLVVVAGQPRRWHLVSLDRPDHATDRTVTLPNAVYLPYPIPRSWLSVSSIEPRTVPLGFSADGRWIYGGVISPELGVLIGAFRVAVDGKAVEPLQTFGVGEPDGLVPRPGTIGTRTVDPRTGRIATARINTDTVGGPQTLEVRSADSAHLFDVPGGVTFGWDWGGDGALYTLIGDTFVFPDEIDLVRADENGPSDAPLLATGPLAGGALIGVRDGFAVIGLLAGRPERASQLIAIDVAHPDRRTALANPGFDLLAASLDR